MNKKEKIYTGCVIAVGVFMLIGLSTIASMILPHAQESAKGVFHMQIAFQSILAAVMFITAFLNLRADALLPVNSTVQIIFLFPTVYGIPLAIWGIMLFKKRNRQQAS